MLTLFRLHATPEKCSYCAAARGRAKLSVQTGSDLACGAAFAEIHTEAHGNAAPARAAAAAAASTFWPGPGVPSRANKISAVKQF